MQPHTLRRRLWRNLRFEAARVAAHGVRTCDDGGPQMGGQALLQLQPLPQRALCDVVRHNLRGTDDAVAQQVGREALRRGGTSIGGSAILEWEALAADLRP